MSVRTYTPNDYPEIVELFGLRNFPHPDKRFLPPTGVIVTDDLNRFIIAAGFMFKTDAKVASIGHLISNPKVMKEVRKIGIKLVMKTLESIAENDGFLLVTCATNIEKLGKRFEDLGFIKTDENVSHFRRETCRLQQL